MANEQQVGERGTTKELIAAQLASAAFARFPGCALSRCLTIVTLCLLPILAAAAPVSAPASELALLLRLVDVRLEQMRDVAAYKWIHRLPASDEEREQIVIVKAGRQGEAYGLEPTIMNFFAAQIQAATVIQLEWFRAWTEKQAPFPSTIRDLDTDIRPQLLELGDAITAQAALALPQLRQTERGALDELASREIHVAFLDAESRSKILDSLLLLAYSPRVDQQGVHLARIVAAGQLRVGTTGDYPPFSYRAGKLAGIDINLARNLASTLKVKLVWVNTTWPTLVADLAAQKFDIAMSGISRTPERQSAGFFSRPYARSGKTPIARCNETGQFDSLDKIDRPAVRLIVNPGGTNQQYVDAHIRRATIIVFDDNTRIFNELADGRADVMITDAIEVDLQSRRLPMLCASMPGTLLTESMKAVYLPQSVGLKQVVDRWLDSLEEDGKLAAAFARYNGSQWR